MALGKLQADENGGGIVAEINITPLTDIFLVLLIIFMVTQSAIIESAAKVNLPKAKETSSETRGITIAVTSDSKIFVNNQPVALNQLEATLRDLLAAEQQKLVSLQGDRALFLGDAVHVMDIAKRAGAEEFSIAADKDESR
jgi:biopolymer transport protein ExbD